MDEAPESTDYIDQLLWRVNRHMKTADLPSDLLQRFPELKGKKTLAVGDLQYPELQQALAYIVGYTPTKWLLEQEYEFVKARRLLHSQAFIERRADENIYDWARTNQLTGLCFSGGGIRSATFNLGVLQALAMENRLRDFDYLSSVSGGGYIHSWLAAWLLRKTREFEDIAKETKTKDPTLDLGLDPRLAAWQKVMERLQPLSTGYPITKQAVWPRQIQWLRRYSNYLTPQKGLLSGDTWAAAAVWLRNVLLNQALLLTTFFFLLCVPHLFSPDSRLLPLPSQQDQASQAKTSTISNLSIGQVEAKLTLQLTTPPATGHDDSHFSERFLGYFHPHKPAWRILWPALGATWTALFFYVFGCTTIGVLLWIEFHGATPGSSEGDSPARRGGGRRAGVRNHELQWVFGGVVAPLFLFGLSLTVIVVDHAPDFYWTVKVFVLLLVLVWVETFSGGALSNTVAQEQDRLEAEDLGAEHKPGFWYTNRSRIGLLLLGIPAALTGTVLAAAVAALLRSCWIRDAQQWLLLNQPWPVQVTAGTLLFFWVAPLTMVVASGMIGKLFPDWMAEWLGRVRGYTLITGIGWIGLCGGALLLPGIAVRVASYHWFAWSSVGAWLVTTLTGVLSGKSGKTSGDQSSSSSPLELVAVVAPYVYILGLLVLLSWLIDLAQNHGWVIGSLALVSWLLTLVPSLACMICFCSNLAGWIVIMMVLFGLGFLLQWRLDINRFSMHNFYRNRLTRCYLGASNPIRNPSPVTGFDEHDSSDVCIHDLTPDHYPGPIPIFSCALNITFGEDLAWQERKAASFAFTPFYSGYTVGWTSTESQVKFNGFVPTSMLYPGGPTVATAMAASGAAFSPNWGYHTNSATAFLLTMFDARLGLWVPNPRISPVAGRRKAKEPVPPASPRFAIFTLIKELLGSVDDTSQYVYVTDGGHFDNSGLYELVRRRCYRIVICDSEQDEDYVFEAIGGAIRKCRIDFGVEIELDLSPLMPNSKTQLSPSHVAKGFIRYPETPGDRQRGTVTYIKSSLVGGKPPAAPVDGAMGLPNVTGDVQAYKREHAQFPHDPTANQWFTESQFESYRRLGQKIVEDMKGLY